jgi:elongation factor Ts
MAEITAALVKDLRERTGAGMMDCKRALGETGGDMETAVDWLRKNGLAAAAKKADRVASEGLVAVAIRDGVGALIEVNTETDFVARNKDFQDFVKTTVELSLDVGEDVETIKAAPYPGDGNTVEQKLTRLIATIGENMNLRRAGAVAADPGLVASYVHNSVAPGLGKIGVLVALESQGDKEKLAELGKQLAMHVAATSPQAVSVDDLDAKIVERERDILMEQARLSGKSEDIVGKMVEGRLRKYYQDVVLLEQCFVIDGETKVAKVIDDAAAEVGAGVKVKGFVRFALGEGIEREDADFAAEVAELVGESPGPPGA